MSGSCKGMPFSNATVLQRKLLGLRWEGGIHLQQKLTDMKKIVFAFALILLVGTGGVSAKRNKVALQDVVVSLTSAGVTSNVEDVEIAQDILTVMNGFDLARKWAHGPYLKSSFDDKGWVAELFVPFDGLKHKCPAVYSTWFGNVIYSQRRTVTANNISASFSFTMKDNRNMDLWGQFKFMGFDD